MFLQTQTKHPLVFSVAFSLTLSFSTCLAFPYQALANDTKTDLPPSQVSEIEAIPPSLPEKAEKERTDVFLKQIKTLKWDNDLPHDKEMSLFEALQKTSKHNWNIQIAQKKIEETEAKQDGVESKRILFFFKYFDARYLEGSAESDVQAQQEHARLVQQNELKKTVTLYNKALEAALTNKVAYWQIKQALMQRTLDQHQFNTGQVTAFVLNSSTQALYTHYQNYLRTLSLRKQAAHALALQTTGQGKQTIVPIDLINTGDDEELELPSFATGDALDIVKKPNSKVWNQYALLHRPDYQELFYRHESVEKLRTASKLQFDRQQTRLIKANLESLKLRLNQLEQVIKADIEQTISDLKITGQQLQIAQQQQQLAKRSLHQAKVSHKAGFSSDKDLVDAQLVSHASQLQYAKAQLSHFQTQVNAFASIGELKPELFMPEHHE